MCLTMSFGYSIITPELGLTLLRHLLYYGTWDVQWGISSTSNGSFTDHVGSSTRHE